MAIACGPSLLTKKISTTAKTDLGIPLRLTTDPKEYLFRSTVQQTYDKIISDIQMAIPLLPSTLDTLHLNRASQPAAYAMLARVYLSMSAYREAREFGYLWHEFGDSHLIIGSSRS